MFRKVGLELEVVASDDFEGGRALVDHLGQTTRFVREGYNHIVRDHWKVVTDVSLTSPRGHSYEYCAEVVSPPILWDEAGRETVRSHVAELDAAPVTVNRSCGLHVHIEVADLTYSQFVEIVRLYHSHQSLIDTVVPNSRKSGSSNAYLGGLSHTIRTLSRVSPWSSEMGSRYVMVNPNSYHRYKTIEFRQHSGTTQFSKIEQWIDFLMVLIETAKNNAPVESPSSGRRTHLVRGSKRRRQVQATRSRTQHQADAINKVLEKLDAGMLSVDEFHAILNAGGWYGRRHAAFWAQKGWVTLVDPNAGEELPPQPERKDLLAELPLELRRKMRDRAATLARANRTGQTESDVAAFWRAA